MNREFLFYHKKLENGLTIIGEERSGAVSAAIGFFVRTGARDESVNISGVSHFLEHMMFKGTATRSCLDITYQMGMIGAQSNAFTSEENTVYYMAILPEYLPKALELLCDMLRPKLAEEDFDVEKKVILEEIALYQDRPTHVLFENAVRTFFGNHPAGNSILGSIESISALSVEQMRAYFNAQYVPSNITFVISGNFNWNEVCDLVSQYCSSWKDKAVSRDCSLVIPVSTEKTLKRANLQQAHFCIMTLGPSAQEEERYEASLLSCILGDSSGSRAYWELVDKGLADSASIDIDDMDGTGMVYGYVSSTPENISRVSEVLLNIMQTPEEFNERDLERARTKILTKLVLQNESSMRRLMSVGLDWIYRKEYFPVSDEIKRIKSVSIRSIRQMLEKYNFKPTTFLKLIPE